jgi:hypothetical protein
MEKISWIDRVRNEKVLLRVKEQRNNLHTIKFKKKGYLDWSHLAFELSYKTCYRRKEVGRREVTGSRGGRRKQLLDDVKEKRGYWKLKEEALDRTL